MILRNKKINKNRGFTLVETLVALMIFSVSITGLISISSRGINDNVFVKNKITASYLAAEGIEFIRNMRDTSAILGVPWSDFISSNSDGGVGMCYSSDGSRACYMDIIDIQVFAGSNINQCQTPDDCPKLLYDSQGGYNYQSGQPSPFTRVIRITPSSSGVDEIFVTSEVFWQKGNNTHRVSYKYNLFNWFGL